MDNNVIIENLTELLTNSVNMTSVFYDIFLNPEPMDVELEQYNDQNELVTITIPNRAKDMANVLSGNTIPTMKAAMGTIYINTMAEGFVYINITGESDGWTPLVSGDSLISYLSSYLNQNGYITSHNIATDQFYGIVKYDGETINVNGNGQLQVPVATDDSYGLVKYDGETINVNSDGQLQVAGNINAESVTNINTSTAVQFWAGTQADYDLIDPKDPDTIYIITED